MQVTAAADVYSFGLTMRYVLCDYDRPEALAALPPALARLIAGCTVEAPSCRPSAQELADALADLAVDLMDD